MEFNFKISPTFKKKVLPILLILFGLAALPHLVMALAYVIAVIKFFIMV